MKTRKKEKNSSSFNTSAIENFGIEHAEMDIDAPNKNLYTRNSAPHKLSGS